MDSVTALVLRALDAAKARHDRLDEKGLEPVRKNAKGDTALRADIECEEVVIQTLKDAQFPAVVYSEEHGIVNLTESPEYVVVIDGIDGTKTYREERGVGRYGTLLGVFAGANPRYADYVAGGYGEHGTNTLWYFTRGKGVRKQNVNGLVRVPRTRFTTFAVDTPISLDGALDAHFKTRVITDTFATPLAGSNFRDVYAAAAHFIDVANGASAATLQATRAGNLEIAALYGAIAEQGGVVVTLDGKDIGDKQYATWGQGKTEFIPFIAAGTPQVATSLLQRLAQR